jgi:transaldolase
VQEEDIVKMFVDSANLAEIEEALKRGFASGVTTNPSIITKEELRDFKDHVGDLIALLRQ